MNRRRSLGSNCSRAAMIALCAIGLLGARSTQACAVCFTGDGTVLTGAVNGMIYVMLGALVCVLGAFLAFIVYLAKRERQATASHEAVSGGPWGSQPSEHVEL